MSTKGCGRKVESKQYYFHQQGGTHPHKQSEMHPIRIRVPSVQIKPQTSFSSNINRIASFTTSSQRLNYRSFTTQKPTTETQQQQSPHTFKFDVALLEQIVCPVTKTKLRYDEANQELISDELSIAFPIKNGTPHLLPQSGRVIDAEKLKKRMNQQA